jgi:hypothetical protein
MSDGKTEIKKTINMGTTLTVANTGGLGKNTTFSYDFHGFSDGDVHVVLGPKDIKVEKATIGGDGAYAGNSGTIGNQSGGTVPVTATGSKGEQAIAFLTINPRIEIKDQGTTTYYVGTTVKVRGDGFIAGETVNIYDGGAIIASTTAKSNGDIEVDYAVPNGAKGIRVVTAIGQFASNNVQYTVTPKITSIEPLTGTDGTPVRVQGNGLDPNKEPYTLDLGGSPNLIGTNGSFDETFSFTPGGIGEGPLDVAIRDNTGTYVLDKGGNIVKYPDKFVYSKAANAQDAGNIITDVGGQKIGGVVKVRGYSFMANLNIGSLKLGERILTGLSDIGAGQVLNDQITTDNNGAFEVSIVVPEVVGGNYTVSVTNVTPTGLGNLTVNPSISLPATAKDGEWVRVTGKGYLANQNIGKLKFKGVDIGKDDIVADGVGTVTDGDITTDGMGRFAVRFKVPYQAEGEYIVTAGLANAKIRETGHARIVKLDPGTRNVGDILTIGVQGFPANKAIKAQIAGKDVTGGNTDVDGKREWAVIVPVVPGGSQTVRVWCEVDNTDKQSTQGTITVAPEVTAINPLQGQKGDSIDVTGTGFGAGEQLTVWIADMQVPGALGTAKNDGTFLVAFNVPDYAYGSYPITVKGHTSASDTYPVNFAVKSKLVLSPIKDGKQNHGQGPVTATGSGFIAGDSLSLKFAGTTQTVLAGGDGSFAVQLSLLEVTRGNKDVKVESPTDNKTNQTKTFLVEPFLSLNPSSAFPGDSVIVEGFGFDPGGPFSNVTLKVDDQTVKTDVLVSAGGRFNPVTITVPTMAPHDALVKGIQASIEITNAKLVIKPGVGELVVTPTSGNIGAQVAVTAPASTFKTNETVDLYFAGNKILTKNPNADGGFTASFTVPVGTTGGDQVVQAKSASVTKQTTFKVEPGNLASSPSEGTIGSVVTVKGDGFAEGDKLAVDFGEDLGADSVLAPVDVLSGEMVNADGTFELRFGIPDRAYSSANFETLINVKGSPSGLETGNISSIKVRIEASRMSVDPTTGTVDTEVAVFGMIVGAGGVKANENIGTLDVSSFGTTVSVDLAGNPDWVQEGTVAGNDLVTNANGRFKAAFKLSDAVAGTQLALIGGQSVTFSLSKVSGLSTVYTVKATVAANPAEAVVGEEVTVTGSGYMPETEAKVKIGDTEVATTTADDTGSISATFNIPEGTTGGDKNVVISQKIGVLLVQSSAPAALKVKGQVTKVEPPSAIAGGQVDVMGDGFGATEALGVKLNDQDVAADKLLNAFTTDTGTFSVTATLPDDAPVGTHTLTITGATSGISAAGTVEVRKAAAVATPTEGDEGDVVTVEGEGFTAGAVVEFYMGDAKLEGADVTAEADGTFTATITVDKVYADGTKLTAKSGDLQLDTGFSYMPLIQSVAAEPTDPVGVGGTINVTAVANRAISSAKFTIPGVDGATDVAMTQDPLDANTYKGAYTAVAGDTAEAAKVTVSMTDANNNTSTLETTETVTIDTTADLTDVAATPDTVKNGDTLTLTAKSEAGATVMADVSALDNTKTTIPLTESTETPGVFSTAITISEDNTATNGVKEVAFTAEDVLGNTTTTKVNVTLRNFLEYTLNIGGGLSIIQIPFVLQDPMMLSDLAAEIGDATALIRHKDGVFLPSANLGDAWSNDVELVGGEVMIVVRPKDADAKSVKLTGKEALPGTMALMKGINLVGVPVNDPTITKFADLKTAIEQNTTVLTMIGAQGGQLTGDPTKVGDLPIMGDTGLLLVAGGDTTLELSGDPWDSTADALPTPYIGAANMDTTVSPILIVNGLVRSEDGISLDNIKVKVENSTTAKSIQAGVESGVYVAAMVDLGGEAVKIGDTIVVDAVDPSGAYVADPVRLVITEDDIINGSLLKANLVMKPVPKETALLKNYPNPFNPETWIPFLLSDESDVVVRIYDSVGRVIRTVDLGHLRAGYYVDRDRSVYWDGRNEHGEQVASGVYFYQIQAGSFAEVKRMVLLK